MAGRGSERGGRPLIYISRAGFSAVFSRESGLVAHMRGGGEADGAIAQDSSIEAMERAGELGATLGEAW